MSWDSDSEPSARRWHGIGLTGFLSMLALYAAAGRYAGEPGVGIGLYWVLSAAALVAGTVAVVGRIRGWQDRRALLTGWAGASLVVTTLVGVVEPDATRSLPGTITITFAYVGLTCPRWRSLLLVPLGTVAFIVGGVKEVPGALPTVVVTAVMWILVAEVPAWLIARLEAQSMLLREIAETDDLTGLLNRSTLVPLLTSHATGSAVLLIDLDDFKPYNDTHGHEAGDRLLIHFAETLRRSARKQDMVFRLGGDEFLLMLVDAPYDEAEQVLRRIRGHWAQTGFPVGFSAGIASGGPDLMRTADQRMYENKRSRGLPAD